MTERLPSTLPWPASGQPLHRAPRRPTTMDRVRARKLLERLSEGEDELEAFWAIASDSGIGLSRYRGVTELPPEKVLRRKMASLLQRAVPEIVERAKEIALGRLGVLSADAVNAVGEVVTGEFEDGSAARARLDAARVILGAIGVREPAGSTATANVVVSLGDGLRALRHVPAEVKDAGDGDG